MLVVEHEPQVIAIADRVVDMGPGAGVHGGTVVYQGDVPGLRASETITGRHFSTVRTLKENVRDPAGALRIEHATLHNLRDVTVDVPLGVAVRPMLAALGDVVAGADWVIDMGPGPGHDGGTIVFAGPPQGLLDAEGSLTGRHLAERLAAA